MGRVAPTTVYSEPATQAPKLNRVYATLSGGVWGWSRSPSDEDGALVQAPNGVWVIEPHVYSDARYFSQGGKLNIARMPTTDIQLYHQPGMVEDGRVGDDVTLTYTPVPVALQVYVQHVERGTTTTLLALGGTSARSLEIDVTGSNYRAQYEGDTGVSSVTMATAPSTTDVVETLVTLDPAGTGLTITQEFDQVAQTPVTDATVDALPPAWGAQTVEVTYPADPTSTGFSDFVGVCIRAGTAKDIAFFRSLF